MEKHGGEMPSLNDLIRIGVYSQMEGTFFIYKKHNSREVKYTFSFYPYQISDMDDLLKRVAGKSPLIKKDGRLVINSKQLYEVLTSLDFKSFHNYDWNMPLIDGWGIDGRKEYIRAVIDSLGDVDIKENIPSIQISSVNKIGLNMIYKSFGGNLNGPYSDRYFLVWRGEAAKMMLNYLDWKFYNNRNMRGANLIRIVRWQDYILS